MDLEQSESKVPHLERESSLGEHRVEIMRTSLFHPVEMHLLLNMKIKSKKDDMREIGLYFCLCCCQGHQLFFGSVYILACKSLQ